MVGKVNKDCETCGINLLHDSIRKMVEMDNWKNEVRKKDGYKCQRCGDSKGGNLNVHHIIPFKTIVEMYHIGSVEEAKVCKDLWDVSNGITICEQCHISTHKESIFVGVDPGLDGAISAIVGKDILIFDCPTYTLKSGKRMFDIPKLVGIIKSISSRVVYRSRVKVILERTQPMPGQGVSSMWKIGYCQGMYEGILSGLGIEYSIVQAKVWQLKLFGKYGKEKTKEESIRYVKKNYPKAELIPKRCKVPKDGRADALCMAIYSELVNGGN